jgi:hypothetical protein
MDKEYPRVNEAIARLHYYRPWILSAEEPRDAGARIFALLSSTTPPRHFFSMFTEYWAEYSRAIRQSLEGGGAVVKAASFVLGGERVLDEYLARTHYWVIYFVQQGGRGAERELEEIDAHERALRLIETCHFAAKVAPYQSDTAIAEELKVFFSSRPDAPPTFTATDWHAAVAEARRRFAWSALGRVLEQDDQEARAEGLDQQAREKRRIRVLGVAVGVRPPEEEKNA